MLGRRKGFTLIELLVVIAIIGILASMVFPVFARARESARKAVCLSNVKNIALAFQMYLADNNDTLPTSEHRQEVFEFFQAGGFDPGSDCGDQDSGWDKALGYATRGNPYLRFPVVLDEYIRNRDVWACPSAKMTSGAVFILPGPDWFGYLQASEGAWGGGFPNGPCAWPFPSGWGGDVTDSIAQQRWGIGFDQLGGETRDTHKAFVQSIMTNDWHGTKVAAVDDPVNFVVCADGGSLMEGMSPGIVAFPDICCAECTGTAGMQWGWPSVDCPSGAYCPCPDAHAPVEYMQQGTDTWRKTKTRHLGGVNLGFLDGHASWIHSEALLNKFKEGDLDGIAEYCGGGSQELYEQNCGDSTGIYFLY
jgi:prepilin-type N-terminal cleavage/methylation domain-containing protein/prepilin-type processing-associated H-X9-DG protein